MPLPDQGWKQTRGAYLEDSDALLLVDENEDPLPIRVSDIRQVIKGEKFNLLLAQVFTYGMHPDLNVGDLRGVLPSPNITGRVWSVIYGY